MMNINHDARVQTMIDEMSLKNKESRTPEEWKAKFKKQGFEDDECDLAYTLCGRKVNYGPLGGWGAFLLLLAAGGALFFYLMSHFAATLDDRGKSAILFIIISFLPLFLYVSYVSKQQKSLFKELLLADFNAKAIENPERTKNHLKTLSEFFRHDSDAVDSVITFLYDGRNTTFGEYQYTVGSGKHQHTYHYFFVIQEIKKQWPRVYLFPNEFFSELDHQFSEKVGHWKLESTDFNKRFSVYSANGQDAFYVFNPRVMQKMIDANDHRKILAMETLPGALLMVFSPLSLKPRLHFSGPPIPYSNYASAKKQILDVLDEVADLSDVLQREMVDDASKRSPAKDA